MIFLKGGARQRMNSKPIAVFDSGLGGISVLRRLIQVLPEENFLYFGDSANAPYGSRATEEIRALTLENADRLFSRGAKALVVSCNTATSAAIDTLRERYPNRIIIGIEPALKLTLCFVASRCCLVPAAARAAFVIISITQKNHLLCTIPCGGIFSYNIPIWGICQG